MKATTKDLFDKANRLLVEADTMIVVKLFEAAGRNAYLAGCCAARGLIFEESNQVVSRHQRLWGDVTGILHKRGIQDPALTAFLPNAYSFKRVADYETGISEVTPERAQKAVLDATAYVAALLKITETPRPSSTIKPTNNGM